MCSLGLTRAGLILVFGTVIMPIPSVAQGPVLGAHERTTISAWEGAAAGAGVGLTFLLDAPARRFFQQHRSRTLNGLADAMRPMGEPIVYGTLAGGILAAGWISGDDDLELTAGRLIFAEAATYATNLVLKLVTGRSRPDSSADPFDFHPFRNRQSGFVSGHTSMAFVLATTLSEEIDGWVDDALLYTFAGGTAWSRLNDNRHWPSDVVGGALLGYSIGKMAVDQWELFGVRTPRFLQQE